MGNRLSKITTRTGDNGTTGLGDGSRVDKDDLVLSLAMAVHEGARLGLPVPPDEAYAVDNSNPLAGLPAGTFAGGLPADIWS